MRGQGVSWAPQPASRGVYSPEQAAHKETRGGQEQKPAGRLLHRLPRLPLRARGRRRILPAAVAKAACGAVTEKGPQPGRTRGGRAHLSGPPGSPLALTRFPQCNPDGSGTRCSRSSLDVMRWNVTRQPKRKEGTNGEKRPRLRAELLLDSPTHRLQK